MTGLFVSAVAAAAASSPITAPGPLRPLAGTLIDAGPKSPVVLMVPGSGPTDRDGNNPLGVTAAPYRMLAEALGKQGVSTVRIDKRGLGGSKSAVKDGNDVTIANYVTDVHSWVNAIRARTQAPCVWLLGHSEGGLIALAAGQQPSGICGLVLVSAPGRRMSDIILEQLRANPGNAPILAWAMAAINALEAGKKVDTATMNPALTPLFGDKIQGFLIDAFHYDPPKLAASLKVPVLIVQGGHDLQVSLNDAKALATAQPKARLNVIPAMNHVLKDIATDDRTVNLASYSDASLPVDESLVTSIAKFVKRD